MSTEILAACGPGEVRVAVRSGRTLVDYAIWRPGAPDGVGDLFRGRVVARVPAMAGAFVTLGDVEGFLPDSAGGADATAGTVLTVRIARAAQGGKGPRLAAVSEVPARAAAGASGIGLLARGPGALELFAGRYPDAPVVIDDAGVAAALPETLRARVRVLRAAFDEDVAGAVEALAEPVAALPGGARLHVTPTPALTALDVDLGAATASRGGKAASQRDANAALLPAIAREIRLRNLGGAIVLDLGGMAARRRAALGPALAAALAADPLAPKFLGFTALGLAEIVRPRVHPPLHELLAGPHAEALTALRAAESAALAQPGRPPALIAAPSLIAALERDGAALAAFARRTGQAIRLIADPALDRRAALAWRLGEANP